MSKKNKDVNSLNNDKPDIILSEKDMFDLLMKNITDSIYFKDKKSRFIKINKFVADRFGISSEEEAIGKTDFDFFSKEHALKAFHDEQKIIKTKKPLINIEEKETWEDKKDRWVSTTKWPIFDSKGNVVGTFGISRDITEKKEAENALIYRESQINAMLETTAEGFFLVGPNDEILFYNDTFLKLWEIPKEVISKSNSAKEIREYVAPQLDNPKEFMYKTDEIYHKKEKSSEIILFKNGKIIERSSAPLIIDKKLVGRVWFYRDITKQKRNEEKLQKAKDLLAKKNKALQKLALRDSLTGAYNHKTILEILNHRIIEAQRYSLPLTILMFDIDDFKCINDNFGHKIGDYVIKKIVRITQSTIRKSDIIGRYGGDEFLVIFPNTSLKEGYAISERIRDKIFSNYQLNKLNKNGMEIIATISGGITQYINEKIDDVIIKVDQLLYNAKRKGKNRIEKVMP